MTNIWINAPSKKLLPQLSNDVSVPDTSVNKAVQQPLQKKVSDMSTISE